MIELDKRFETDWGADGMQWTGLEVQSFLKNVLKQIIEEVNRIDQAGNQGQVEQYELPKATVSTLGGVKVGFGPAKDNDYPVNIDKDGNIYVTISGLDSLSSMQGCNKVTTLTSVPVDKKLVIATITTNQTLSFKSTPPAGAEIHIIVMNNQPIANRTVTLTADDTHIIFGETSFTLKPKTYIEINAISDGTNVYLRASE